MSDPLLPKYGTSSLADLLPSLGAQFGVPGAVDVLGLPEAPGYVLLLVDGLGASLLSRYADAAPYLSSLGGQALTCGLPSTTATSITSLGTGLVPGQHGVAGYSFWYAPLGGLLDALHWPSGVSGLDVQPKLTYLERLVSASVSVNTVAPAAFVGSGLTSAGLRGGRFWPVHNENDLAKRVEVMVSAATAGTPSFCYAYERGLDHAGHEFGTGSTQWLAQLRNVDSLARGLREALPASIRLLVTGDHGMVDVPSSARLLVEDEPALLDDVIAFGGEGRFRQLYVRAGRTGAVADRWRSRLGERAWVRTRDEAVAQGWFGPVDRQADRFGDVLVAMADNGAVLSRARSKELSLVGMHGSATPDEMMVPLLIEGETMRSWLN